MEVDGAENMHAVEIMNYPDAAAPFSFRSVMNPQLVTK